MPKIRSLAFALTFTMVGFVLGASIDGASQTPQTSQTRHEAFQAAPLGMPAAPFILAQLPGSLGVPDPKPPFGLPDPRPGGGSNPGGPLVSVVRIDTSVVERAVREAVEKAARDVIDKAMKEATSQLPRLLVPPEIRFVADKFKSVTNFWNDLRKSVERGLSDAQTYAMWAAAAFFGVLVLASILGGTVVALIFRRRAT